jgi:type I restriction enzyme S subunit
LRLIEIPLPPLETQKAIVAKLDQIFAELDQTKSEIQKNLDNTDELWKSALNQAFQGDWEMKKLGEMAEI